MISHDLLDYTRLELLSLVLYLLHVVSTAATTTSTYRAVRSSIYGAMLHV